MIAMLLALQVAWATDPTPLQQAAQTEMARAMEGLRLPDQPAPYHIAIQILDGQYATIFTQDGSIVSHDEGPHREARVDVRVGDSQMDSANFSASIGNRDGTQMRGLHHEDQEIATRRELWLALDRAYKGATETYASKTAARSERENTFPPDLSEAAPFVQAYTPPNTVDQTKLFERVQALTEAVQDDPHLENSAFLGHDWQGARLILNTEGTEGWLPSGRAVIRGEVIGKANDGARIRNTRSWLAKTVEDLPDPRSMVQEMVAASHWLQSLQTAPVERDYLGPVLFEGPASAELFRQLLHPEISGTPPPESAPDPMGDDAVPVPTARMGRRLLPSGWSVEDDPARHPEHASHYTHDHEGVAVRSVQVIEDGVLKDVLMSRTPRMDKTESTGHGRAIGGDRRVAMPGQVFVRPPKTKSADKLRRMALAAARSAGLPYVLVIRRITPPSLSEDFEFAVTGDGPLSGLTQPEEAFRLYMDGTEEPVRGLQFSGVDRRVLRDIMANGRVANPVEMLDSSGTSERFTLGEASGVPVSWSVPPVLIAEMELRGSSGGEKRIIPKPTSD